MNEADELTDVYFTYWADNKTITYEPTKPYATSHVGKQVKFISPDTVALATGEESAGGKLVSVGLELGVCVAIVDIGQKQSIRDFYAELREKQDRARGRRNDA